MLVAVECLRVSLRHALLPSLHAPVLRGLIARHATVSLGLQESRAQRKLEASRVLGQQIVARMILQNRRLLFETLA